MFGEAHINLSKFFEPLTLNTVLKVSGEQMSARELQEIMLFCLTESTETTDLWLFIIQLKTKRSEKRIVERNY